MTFDYSNSGMIFPIKNRSFVKTFWSKPQLYLIRFQSIGFIHKLRISTKKEKLLNLLSWEEINYSPMEEI